MTDGLTDGRDFGFGSQTTEFNFWFVGQTTVLNFGFGNWTRILNLCWGSLTTVFNFNLVVGLYHRTFGWLVKLEISTLGLVVRLQ